jgi:hypothetical protein
MGYASQHAGVVGSIPIRVIAPGSSVVRAQLLRLQVRILLSHKRDSSTVEHYIDNVEVKKYTASQKMVTDSKVGVACRQYMPMTLCCDAAKYYSKDLKGLVP